MSGLEERILTLVKELEEEKRLADKRAKQLYLATGGATTFLGLTDTPAAYAEQAGKFVKVNATPDALVFAGLAAGDLPGHTHDAGDLNAGIVPSARLSQTQAFYSTDPRLPVTNQVHTTLSGPTIAELSIPSSPYIRNNLQFVVPIIHEYTENGVDWYATSYTATQLKKWVGGRNMGANLIIPSPNVGEWEAVRFTFQAPAYNYMNWLYLYMSNGGHSFNFKIEKSYGAEEDNWIQVAQTSNTGGWPSHHSIPHSNIPWHSTGGTPGTHSKYMRLTIYPVYNPSYPANGITLYNINWYGYYPANPQTDTWYWDEDNNFYIKQNLNIPVGKKLYLGTTYYLDNSGLVANNKVADSDRLNSQLASYYAVSGGAEHDGFSDFVANEHINHGSVSMIAGSGLSGGGTIAASRTFNLGALTAAWDAGSHQIRALKFYSDQATGVAPLIVASTTKVTNLNADLLEGYHASSAAGNNTIVLRTSSGYIYCNYLNCTSGATTSEPTHYFVETGNDSFLRQMTPANFVSKLAADGLMPKAGGIFTGHAYARDHPTGLTDAIINVCYGTGAPPAANTTTIGSLFIKYTA